MIRPGVFGEKHEGYFVAQDDCKFEVFKDEVILVFESEFTDSGFEIQINQRSYKIDAFEYSTVEVEVNSHIDSVMNPNLRCN